MLFNVSITKFAHIAVISLCAIGLNISVTHAEEDVTDIAAAQVNPKLCSIQRKFLRKKIICITVQLVPSGLWAKRSRWTTTIRN